MDLNDEDVRGGELGDLTLAIYWYPNPNFRWMLNYVRADLENSGEANIFQSRFMVFF